MIDVMIPYWGRFDHLRLAVESVLAQTDPRFRLVVVDDRYPDPAAGEWLRSVGDERVTYLRNDRNLGVSGNFRRCVELMTSERGVLMGCDDVMLPDYVERVHELVGLHPDAAIIQPGVSVIDGDGRRVLPLADRVKRWCAPRGRRPLMLSGEPLATSLLRGNWAYFPSVCWRRRDLARYEFRLDLEIVQDLAMMLDICFDSGSLLLDDRPVFLYRRHAASASARTGTDATKYAQEASLFSETADRASARGWRRAARAASLHLTSRLHAMTDAPPALRAADATAIRALLAHVIGSTRRG